MKKYLLKVQPYKTLHLGYFCWWSIVLSLLFEIAGLIEELLSQDGKTMLIAQCCVAGVVGVGLLGFIAAKVFYRTYWEITDEAVVKYRWGKEIFRVRREEIVGLGYRKMRWYMWILMPFVHYVGFTDPMCGVLSLRYREHETMEYKGYIKMYLRVRAMTDEEKAAGIQEYLEGFTGRDVKKISAVLGLPVEAVQLQYVPHEMPRPGEKFPPEAPHDG